MKVVAETPDPAQGEMALRPRPVPKASSTRVIAHAVTAPAMMEGHETPDGEPAGPPVATTTVSTISFAPQITAPRAVCRNNEHAKGKFQGGGTFGGRTDFPAG